MICLTARMYGARSHKNKKLIEGVEQAVSDAAGAYYHQAMKEARKMLDEDRKTYFRNKRRGYL